MMRFGPSMLKSPLLVVIAASAFSQSSFADTLNLNYTATYNGTSIINTAVNPALNTPAATSQSTYTHSLPNLTNTIPGSVNALNNPMGSEFYDDYVFTMGGSQLSSITATIDLGTIFNIDNLNVRLFSWSSSNEQLSDQVTIGAPPATPLQAWTYATGTGEVAVIDQTNLGAGTYVLQVRGNTSGTLGGSYVGTLNVAPVPLPAALPLLMSGLGLLGGLFGRRAAV
jgi:hypothetical protein